MKIKVLTIFPEMLSGYLSSSVIGRALDAGLFSVELIDIRPYSQNKHKNTDDYPFGGGAGMVMLAQPIVDAAQANASGRERRIYLSPRGRTLNQRIVEELAQEEELMLLCGHYEGVDERALEIVLPRGAFHRRLCAHRGRAGGAGGDRLGFAADSRGSGQQRMRRGRELYYRPSRIPAIHAPARVCGCEVPEVLLNGNHALIDRWRREQALQITRERRPELLKTAPLDKKDWAFLQALEEEP